MVKFGYEINFLSIDFIKQIICINSIKIHLSFQVKLVCVKCILPFFMLIGVMQFENHNFSLTGVFLFLSFIMYSLYSPYYVSRTPTTGSAVPLSRVSVCITWPVYCTVNSGYKIQDQIWVSQASLGYRRFQIGCLIVEYGLFNTTKSDIYTFWYNFDTVLY